MRIVFSGLKHDIKIFVIFLIVFLIYFVSNSEAIIASMWNLFLPAFFYCFVLIADRQYEMTKENSL